MLTDDDRLIPRREAFFCFLNYCFYDLEDFLLDVWNRVKNGNDREEEHTSLYTHQTHDRIFLVSGGNSCQPTAYKRTRSPPQK